MSDKVYYKEKFIKQKTLNKRLRAVAAMAEAKKRKKQCPKHVGTRIVEIDELANNLTCCKCQKDIFLKNIIKETRFGLNSVFSIKCQDLQIGYMHCCQLVISVFLPQLRRNKFFIIFLLIFRKLCSNF